MLVRFQERELWAGLVQAAWQLKKIKSILYITRERKGERGVISIPWSSSNFSIACLPSTTQDSGDTPLVTFFIYVINA